MTASDLPQLAQVNSWVRGILDDESTGHRSAARTINARLGEGTTSEKSVRRYRNKRLQPGALTNPQPPIARPTVKPSGGSWQAGIDIDPAVGGEFRTKPREVGQPTDPPLAEPEEAALLAEFDLDPAVWKITHARKSLWQSGDRWLEARKVSFVRRESATSSIEVDVEGIMARYLVTRPVVHKGAPERLLMVPAGDLQLGKPDGGGSPATIERFCRIVDDLADEIKKDGFNTSLILPWMGDCIEGLVSQKGRLVSTLDLTITQQVRAYRRLMMHQIALLAPLAVKVLIPVLPGNHDETYREQSMPVNDSWAIEGASAVADWMSGRPEYEHVEFVFPEPGELGITLNVGTDAAPHVISFHHGHSASTPAGIIPWWKNQSHGRQHAGQADLLVTAHFHHLRVEHTGGNRTWLQIPALDGGSDWYRLRSGEQGVTGIVSVEITPGAGQGWRNLTVHS